MKFLIPFACPVFMAALTSGFMTSPHHKQQQHRHLSVATIQQRTSSSHNSIDSLLFTSKSDDEPSSSISEDEEDKSADDAGDDVASSNGSAAMEWQNEQKMEAEEKEKEEEKLDDDDDDEQKEQPIKIAIVGGGWGGWGAAKAICEAKENVEVTLLDALPDPTGATPFLSKTGKPVEAGTRGFWKDYPNINKLCAELGLDESDIFTPFTNSSFYSPGM